MASKRKQSQKTTTVASVESETQAPVASEETSPEATTETSAPEATVESKTEAAEKTSEPAPAPAPKKATSAEPKLSSTGQHVVDGVASYAAAMAPNMPQTEQSIQQSQRRLKTTIDTLLRLPAEEFGAAIKAVVATIGEHREGSFNERYLFRGFPGLRLPAQDRTRFELMLSLLTTASDVKSFSEVKKHVSMDVLFKYITDNDQQQKLAGMFK